MTVPALSLRNKLLCFAAALIVVPGLALGFIAERSGRDSLQGVIGNQLARESHHTADRLASLLRGERETLRSFARLDLMREIKVADIDKRVSMALVTLRDGGMARRGSLILLPDNQVVASSDPRWLSEAPAWASFERAPTEQIQGPVAASDGSASLFITTPVLDPDDPPRVLGLLVGVYDFDALVDVTSAVRRDLADRQIDTEVLIVRGDGTILGGARSDTSHWPERFAAPVSAFARLGRDARDHRVDEQADFIMGWSPLGSEMPDWNVVVVESLSDALAPARSLARQLTVTMGLALGVALLIATLAARRVTEPLRALTRAIRDLPHGGSSGLQVPVRSNDEVGTLAVTFNRMASELEHAQRDLVEAEKFAFVGELASGVAHEIRTSLGVLRSSAQILQRSLPDDASAESIELATMMKEEVGRLGGVVDDLLTLDRQRALDLEPILVSEPAFRAAGFVEAQAREKQIEVNCVPCERERPVLCDAEVIYQACVNLLVNAISALPARGTVQVGILAPSDGWGGIVVSDDGPGVPADIRDEIFKPFVTATRGGVGLGLTFVKRVLHEHRGRVTLQDGPLSGASFRVELPLAEVG